MMHSKYIHETIDKLKTLGVDFYDTDGNFPKRYNAYLERFKKAKDLIGVSSCTDTLFPLEDPRHLIYQVYFHKLHTEEEKQAFLAEFGRSKVDIDYTGIRDFTDLDREEKWIRSW